MLFYDVFEEIIINQVSEIESNFKEFYTKDEALHDLRVAIRRLLSYFLVFKKYLNTDTQLLNTLKFFLKSSNIARDTQILIEKINQLDIFENDLKELKTYLEKEYGIQKSNFYNILSLSFDDFLIKINQTIVQKSYRKDVFFDFKFETIAFLSLNAQAKKIKKIKPAKKNLHKLRIEYKKYRYILEILQKTQVQNQKIQERLIQLRQLQDKLGYVQDLSVHIEYLKSLKTILPDSINAIEALIETFKSNLKQKRKKVIFLLSFLRFFEINWGEHA
ncbi:CHAD domain-containing protein [Desulfurella sp.]|uniref:CHAD domain-containing protein n=1 Tax=Desulfurella sp. TaxID=1962857 RepID=UPI003D0C532A